MRFVKQIAFLFVLLFLCIFTVSAEETNTFIVDYSAMTHKKGIEGAVFTVSQILVLDNGTYETKGDTDITVNEVLNDPKEAAKKLSEQHLKGQSLTTGSDGKAIFTGLPDGVWLVQQTDRKGEALSYEYSLPYLVSVPYLNGEALCREAVTYPKAIKITDETEKKPGNKTSTQGSTSHPKTGDETNIYKYLLLLPSSLLTVTAVLCLKRKEKRK